ncbi:exopolysaccharide biosynthesis protein [Sphingomonas sp. ID0503]|uniref:exopolysaccharide biosynthesis protein n=1 Tax=Sphingomonas sp. ID0503 TaxID=3399691 RepID=UPI003AFA110F
MADEISSVGDILDKLEDLASKDDRVHIGGFVEAFGQRSYGPFLLVPALLEISPVGGIPGVPTVLAAIILLFAVQMLFGRKHLWLPRFVSARSLDGERVAKGADKLRGLARFLDRWFHGRLATFTKGLWVRIAAALVIVLTLTVPPLELLPFASTAPMAAIAAFGLALLVRDGALMIVAFIAAGLALALGVGW